MKKGIYEMQRRLMRLALYLAMGITVFLILLRPALPIADANEFIGRWSGFSQNAGNPPDTDFGSVVLDVVSARGTPVRGQTQGVAVNFRGELRGIIIHFRESGQSIRVHFAVEGVVSPDNRITMQGVSVSGDRTILRAAGAVREIGNASIRIAALHYELLTLAGVRQAAGELVTLQKLGGPYWDGIRGANVNGQWTGNATSRTGRTARMELQPGPVGAFWATTTALSGMANLTSLFYPPTESLLDVPLEISGTVGPSRPQGDPAIGLLGWSEGQGIVAIVVGRVDEHGYWSGPRRIEGRYFLFDSLPDVLAWTLSGDGAFDQGSLYLPRTGR